MKRRFPIQLQVLLSVIFALASGYLFEGAGIIAGTPAQIFSTTPQPFETTSGLLSVSLRFHRNAVPEVLQVEPLEAGRLTVTQGGECLVNLQDGNGKDIYTLSVAVVFVRSEGGSRESVDRIVVLPNDASARRLVVKCPQGEVSYDLAGN